MKAAHSNCWTLQKLKIMLRDCRVCMEDCGVSTGKLPTKKNNFGYFFSFSATSNKLCIIFRS